MLYFGILVTPKCFFSRKKGADLRGCATVLLFCSLNHANAAPGRCSTSSKVVIVSQGNEDNVWSAILPFSV